LNAVNPNPLVSIVIPVYNGSSYLAEAINSALRQTYKNIEVLVVNDGSSDGGKTEDLALSFGDKIRYYYKPNGHVASALNFGIAHMHGDFFSWLSHDDLYKPNKIATQVGAAMRLEPQTIVYGDYEILDQATRLVTPMSMGNIPSECFRYWITLSSVLHGCALLIPKPCLDACGKFDEALRTTQDYDMWFRLARRCRFVHVPGIVVTSRHHAEQGTRALRNVAASESDRLLTSFISELSRTELELGSGTRASIAYAKIAATMRQRGFSQAADAALKRARTVAREEPPNFRVAYWKARPIITAATRPMRRAARRIWGWLETGDVQRKFTAFYRNNTFRGRESVSGEGSSLEQTATIRAELPKLISEIGATSFLDAPCGDFHWMQHVELGVEKYFGVDVVEDLIAANQRRYGSATRQFMCLNLIEDVPPIADLALCRDCLVHLNFESAGRIVRNFKRSGTRYLLSTTFVGHENNQDLWKGDIWRTLNLELPPFNFPKPLKLINENCTEGAGAYGDKCLGLWRLSDLDLGWVT